VDRLDDERLDEERLELDRVDAARFGFAVERFAVDVERFAVDLRLLEPDFFGPLELDATCFSSLSDAADPYPGDYLT